MATEKDTAMGDLEALNDVFADIMNVLMFKGKARVNEADLEQGREKSSKHGTISCYYPRIIHGIQETLGQG